jgi:hypothetical protein
MEFLLEIGFHLLVRLKRLPTATLSSYQTRQRNVQALYLFNLLTLIFQHIHTTKLLLKYFKKQQEWFQMVRDEQVHKGGTVTFFIILQK